MELENVDKSPAIRVPNINQVNRSKVDAAACEQGDRTIVIFVIGIGVYPFMKLGVNGEG